MLIDATVIRALSRPSVTALLGECTWHLPRWLRRLPDPTHDEHRGEDARPGASGVQDGPVGV
ncbi:hypothetical protein [Streptomyces sp. bgisy022]|uniref:hypothetical protein n=1 Tax=Streptomyces sp. bgisy022 TaxID=3413769 RepID=UPI003D727598